MNKTLLFSIISILFCITSCEKDKTSGCTDPTATNYNSEADEEDNSCLYENLSNADLIIGTWNGNTITTGMDLENDMIQLILAFSMIMTPEEFEEEYETPMPTSDEEWDAFILNLSSQTEDNSGEILIVTENLFTITIEGSPITFNYEFTSETEFNVSNASEDIGIESMEILSLTSSELILHTDITDIDEYNGEEINYFMTLNYTR